MVSDLLIHVCASARPWPTASDQVISVKFSFPTGMLCASVITRTTSDGSSTTLINSASGAEIFRAGSIVSLIQDSRPCQYSLPTSTMGNLVILPVCTSVTASNNSSSVPNPPGSTTNACEYLTNMVLRTKKYRNSRPTSTYSFSPCSCGSSMPRPTESPFALAAPWLAASMMPGPPPVMTTYPALASAAEICRARSYCTEPARARDEPNTDTAMPSSASSPKPSTNSAWIRSTRHGSV